MIVDKTDWQTVVKALQNDKIMAYPTDTVYGLAVKAYSLKAKNNLIARKKRPQEKSFPIMCADLKMIEKVAFVDEKSRKIIENFMPGPLTVILNKKPDLPSFISDKDTLAIRLASDETIKKIIISLNCPIFLTSANLSAFPVCKNVEEIVNFQLADIIVKGEVKGGMASTIVDLSGSKIKLLREGELDLETITAIL